MTEQHDLDGGHEPHALVLRPILWFGFALLAMILVAGVAAVALLGGARPPQEAPAGLTQVQAPGAGEAPVLQDHPANDWLRYRAAQRTRLESYGRAADGSDGYRIPIERAMRILSRPSDPDAATAAGDRPPATAPPVAPAGGAPRGEGRPLGRAGPLAVPGAGQLAFEQHLGAALPAGLRLVDEQARPVQPRLLLADHPGLLLFSYGRCHNACPGMVELLARRLAAVPSAPATEVLVVSIDPAETPAMAARYKSLDAGRLPLQPARWHYLTGDGGAVRQLAESAGFRYRYDAAEDQYDHPAGLVVLAPDGRYTRYFLGFGLSPPELAEALRSAAAGRIGTAAPDLVSLCLHLLGLQAPRSLEILRVLQALTVLLAVLFASVALAWGHRRQTRTEADAAAADARSTSR